MATNNKPSQDVKNTGIFDTVDKLAIGVRSLEDWYAADFRRRLMELSGVLENQIADSLRAELNAGFQQKIEKIRAEHQERLQTHLAEWHSERGSLEQELERLKLQAPNQALVDEIARVQAALQQCHSGIERSIGDDSIALGRLLQMRTEELELKAYLKGLNYCFGLMQADAGADPATLGDFAHKAQ